MTGSLDVARDDAHVVSLIMNNPPANALTYEMRQQLVAALDGIEADTEIRAVILRGKDKNFCTGADLGEKEQAANDASAPQLDDVMPIFRQIERLRIPVIAAVGGWCVGAGLEFALCADIRIAAQDARFMCAGVNVGVLAHAYRLPRTIGVAAAKQMLYTGLPVDAPRALALGLAGEVVERGMLEARAFELALRIASRAPLSVEASKRMADAAFDLTPEQAAIRLDEELAPLFASEDHREALAAFREKRDPHFKRQ